MPPPRDLGEGFLAWGDALPRSVFDLGLSQNRGSSGVPGHLAILWVYIKKYKKGIS